MKLDWKRMVALEPKLAILEEEIKAIKDDGSKPSFCANSIWYGYGEYLSCGFKQRLCEMVGWDAHKAGLRSEETYDLAYDHLYDLLPDCRNCGCL